MKKNYNIYLLFVIFIQLNILNSQNIIVNGEYSDWDNTPTFVDPLNDGQQNGIDIDNVWIDNDDNFLFIRVDLNKEINIQSDNRLTLHIDTDNNINTGKKINGIGAELSYYFGDRGGEIHNSNGSFNIFHDDILLVTAPTASSEQFEIMLSKKIEFQGKTLFDKTEIRIRIEDNATSGDDVPNDLGGVNYTIKDNLSTTYPYEIKKSSVGFRMMSYNVLKDRMFDEEVYNNYQRIFKTTKPDIIAFQEIYDYSASDVIDLLEDMDPGNQWYGMGEGSDIILISKYPIISSDNIGGNGVFFLDVNGENLMIINLHLFCCDNDSGRQDEVDEIMAYVNDVKNNPQNYNVTSDVPYLIVGDTNFVGLSRQVQTILDGDISNNSSYGPDFGPDTDGSSLSKVNGQATGIPAEITWLSNGTYSGGRLDYIFYTDASLTLHNNYSLMTVFMDDESLTDNGLELVDTYTASDHVPVIADFSFSPTAVFDISSDIKVYPNPSYKSITIDLVNHFEGTISILDPTGKVHFSSPYIGNNISIETSLLPSGQYFVKLHGKETIGYKKIIIVRQ